MWMVICGKKSTFEIVLIWLAKFWYQILRYICVNNHHNMIKCRCSSKLPENIQDMHITCSMSLIKSWLYIMVHYRSGLVLTTYWFLTYHGQNTIGLGVVTTDHSRILVKSQWVQDDNNQFFVIPRVIQESYARIPDRKVHWVTMEPTWGWQDPDMPHVGHVNLAIWDVTIRSQLCGGYIGSALSFCPSICRLYDFHSIAFCFVEFRFPISYAQTINESMQFFYTFYVFAWTLFLEHNASVKKKTRTLTLMA